jgi:pyruvate formate lyase activating enzyme
MFIGGLQKFTLIDYPGRIAAVVFTMGCNFRCSFCHNPEIVDPKMIDYESRIEEKEILKFLGSRKGNLEGVCITGGEPTLQLGLAEFIRRIKDIGFLVKLDTNASHPGVIESLINDDIVDYIAVDIKTSPEKYSLLTRKENVVENVGKSINLIATSSVDLELRTTVVPGIVNLEDFDKIIEWVNEINPNIFEGLYRYSIQNFRPEKTLKPDFKRIKPYSNDELEKMANKIRKHCQNVVVLD